MTQSLSLLLAGDVRSSDHTTVYAPFDRTPIVSAAQADGNAVAAALNAAADVWNDPDARLPVAERVAVLQRTSGIMRDRRMDLAIQAAREGGKPLKDSLVEVDRAIDGVHLCIERIRTQHGREIPMRLNDASASRIAFTTHEPIGIVIAFSAFNHPLNLIVHQVAPAVATGCPVIVKPAEATPMSGHAFVEILHQAGLPAPWCQYLLTTDHDTSGTLISDERIAFFSFIGSDRVGWSLRSRLAPGVRCALEHGGAAPVIVADDADLDDALPLLTKGGFYHAGQVCVSVQRVFAHKTIARTLADRLAAEAQALIVGDPTQERTDVGPLIRPDEVTRVHEWVTEAKDAGAEVLCGGSTISETCYAPTVLFNPPDDVRVSTHEIFGPVVCVYEYDTVEQAMTRANAIPYAFQAAVFTKNIDTALQASRRLNATAVMVNDHTAFRVDWMPFAGAKRSGLGIGGIEYTMDDMQIEKMTVIRSHALA